MHKDLFAGVSIQISAISATFSVKSRKHVLLDVTFLVRSFLFNNIWKFKMGSPRGAPKSRLLGHTRGARPEWVSF